MFSASTKSGYKIEFPIFYKEYETISYEGNGYSFVVYKVRKKGSNTIFRSKIFSKADMIKRNCIDCLNKEITIHQMLNHPNIVKIYDAFEMINSKKEVLIFIIEEYCSNRDLLSYINKNGLKSKYDRKNIEKGIFQGLGYLHGIGLAHCDINCANILIDKNLNAKLCNFCRCEFGQNENSIWFKNDIMSLGSVLYMLSEGKQLGKQIYINDSLHIRIEDGKLKNLIGKCTRQNPENRPSMEKLLEDEYFTTDEKEEKEESSDEHLEEEEKDILPNSILSKYYFDYSICYGCKNDIKQSKLCKKSRKKPKKRNNLEKQVTKSKSKSQYFSEKQVEE